MKQRIHKFLFPVEYERVDNLTKDVVFLKADLKRRNQLIQELEKRPKFTTQNISEVLGTSVIDFVNVDKNGIAPKFLSNISPEKRKFLITQLAQIWQLEAFQMLCESHINSQGNFITRQAQDDLQMFCGRMIMKGVALVRDEVKEAFEEYQEGRDPDNKDYEKGSDESFEIGNGIEL